MADARCGPAPRASCWGRCWPAASCWSGCITTPPNAARLPRSMTSPPDPGALHYRFAIDPRGRRHLEHRGHHRRARGPHPRHAVAVRLRRARRPVLPAGPARRRSGRLPARRGRARRSLELLPSPTRRSSRSPSSPTCATTSAPRSSSRINIKVDRAGAPIIFATAHLALGELAEAGDAAQAALSIKPDSNGYLMRALVMQAQGRDAEAALDFTRAARAEEPGDPAGRGAVARAVGPVPDPPRRARW